MPTRPTTPSRSFWPLVLVVLPGLADLAFLGLLVGAWWTVLPTVLLLGAVAYLVAGPTRGLPGEGRVGWTAIGLLVALAIAVVVPTVVLVVAVIAGCGGNCVS